MQIYLARNNVPAGPYTLEQVNSMLASGEVQLTDLAWHEGLEQWQLLYELTGGEKVYQPKHVVQKDNDDADSKVTITKSDDVDEADKQKKSADTKPHRVSVDELYGRKPKKSDNTIDTKKHVKNDETVDVSPNHVKLTQPPASFAPEILASPSTRIIATLIDWLLFAMIYVPLAFYIPQDAFVPAKDFQTAQKNAEMLMQGVPDHIVQMTSIFFFMYIIIQSLLIIRRGQTIGKICTGLQVLDFATAKVPSFASGLLVRGLFTNVIYLAIYFPILAIIDFVFIFFNSDKRCLHDKLAGTIVVKGKEYEEAEEKKKKIKEKLT